MGGSTTAGSAGVSGAGDSEENWSHCSTTNETFIYVVIVKTCTDNWIYIKVCKIGCFSCAHLPITYRN